MTRCPFCFTALAGVPHTAFVCSSGSCPATPDPAAARVLGGNPTITTLLVNRAAEPAEPVKNRNKDNGPDFVRPSSMVCTSCSAPTSAEVCWHCHSVLPPGWRKYQTTTIAVTGARASGKSIYLGVAINELVNGLISPATTVKADWIQGREHYDQHLAAPLYKAMNLVQATPPSNRPDGALPPPMVLHVSGPGVNHVLVLRDIPGEDLERPTLDPHIFDFLTRADGIIFLFDPLRVSGIKAMLAGSGIENQESGGDPIDVLRALTTHLRGAHVERPVTTPMAVSLAKFDTLHSLRHVDDATWNRIMRNPGAAYQRDPGAEIWPHNPTDTALLDLETRSLMTVLGAHPLLSRLTDDYTTTTLIPVSALGHPPTGNNLHVNGIAPFRILDPIKWITAQPPHTTTHHEPTPPTAINQQQPKVPPTPTPPVKSPPPKPPEPRRPPGSNSPKRPGITAWRARWLLAWVLALGALALIWRVYPYEYTFFSWASSYWYALPLAVIARSRMPRLGWWVPLIIGFVSAVLGWRLGEEFFPDDVVATLIEGLNDPPTDRAWLYLFLVDLAVAVVLMQALRIITVAKPTTRS